MNKFYMVILAAVLLFSCKRDDYVYSIDNPKGIQASSIISISGITNLQPEADTATISYINLKISPETDSAGRYISLNTTLGYFLNGERTDIIQADVNGNAKVGLKSAVAGDAVITVSVPSAILDTVIHFIPAFPDIIQVSADNYLVDTSQVVNVTANLFRNPSRGISTDPTIIWFTVTPNLGTSNLVYPSFVYSANHSGTIKIINPFGVKGTFHVAAKALNDTRDTIRTSLSFEIK